MKVLVTRPEPACSELITAITTKGGEAFASPLIRIGPGAELNTLIPQLDSLTANDLVFLLSKNAVEYANLTLEQMGRSWSDKLSYYGIGRSTGQYFQQVTGKDIRWAEQGETSEILLTHPELQFLEGKNALLLRGNGGRELLASTLRARGAQVSYCECYTRYPVDYDKALFNQQWFQTSITDVVITSGQMLALLEELITEEYQTWWFSRRLLVVSERIADQARRGGWQKVCVANSADNNALLEALISIDMGC
ncbi:uroporphyrinogen-III synthase [Providencia hangzhouensis]|uniref:Uroporphyrinogen-III synthase n=2 Tax=Providencia TaxID=586 RepID=A0A9N8GYM3_PRORE|nr:MULTISPECIES: uroporphyrinogen-III synthase [Providencia]MBN7841727.1 uroporphyrinogen-III synthase [Providencia rettgeri]MBN7852507.1 uroporphyrinogen-III synthase [Providencia rettgeri]MBN7861775.1 uroporphyrinogen-III synthase [Providencia rettgeri]MBN7871893.1 uroporphyrinogen-III synthase [Providencia rettgeri]MBN7896010.1 uroporphyrinogen-III synthase [Providencia rettgeri]